MTVLLLFAALGAGGLRNPWAWTLFAVLSWAAASADAPRRPLPAAGLWASVLAWAGLSALTSPEPCLSSAAFAYAATVWLWLLVGATRSGEEERRLGLGLLWACAVVATAASSAVEMRGYYAVGLYYPYYNYTAALVAAAGAAAAAFPGTARWFGPAAAAAFLILVRSRGGLLALGLGTAVALWRSGRRLPLYLAGAAAAVFLAVPSAPRETLLKSAKPGSHQRPAIWRSALAVAAESPWLGEGPGRFSRGSLRHQTPAPPGAARSPARYPLRAGKPHSEPLGVLAETGFIGGGLTLLALALLLRSRPKGLGSPAREGLLAAAAALGVQAAGDSIFTLPALGWLFAWALGASCAREASDPPPPEGLRRAVMAAGLALAAGAWWPGWAVSSRRETSAASALRLAPSDDGLWQALARERLRENDARGALDALGRAVELAPFSAPPRTMAGEVLRATGAWEGLRAVAQETLALEPACGQAFLHKAEAELRLGSPEKARNTLEALTSSGALPLDSMGEHRDRLIVGYDRGRYDALRSELGLR